MQKKAKWMMFIKYKILEDYIEVNYYSLRPQVEFPIIVFPSLKKQIFNSQWKFPLIKKNILFQPCKVNIFSQRQKILDCRFPPTLSQENKKINEDLLVNTFVFFILLILWTNNRYFHKEQQNPPYSLDNCKSFSLLILTHRVAFAISFHY